MSDTIDSDTASGDASTRAAESVDRVIIRFAGDSGDGMQLTGDRFTSASALFGNDLATLPDFPAEIRAPAGTIAGVSAFQVHISDHEITTPGDEPNMLVAMNPAALRSDLHRLESGGSVIINTDAFTERNLAKAGFEVDPRDDHSLDGYKVYEVAMTEMTKGAVANLTKGMATDWAKHGLQCNGLAPGYFDTPLNAALVADPDFSAWLEKRTPAGRWGKVEELVGACIFLSSEASSFVNGTIVYVDGGITASL